MNVNVAALIGFGIVIARAFKSFFRTSRDDTNVPFSFSFSFSRIHVFHALSEELLLDGTHAGFLSVVGKVPADTGGFVSGEM